MRLSWIQVHSGKEDLLEQITVAETVIRENPSVQCDVVRSVIGPLGAIDPHRGPVESERSGGTVHCRQRERSVVVVPGFMSGPNQKR